MKMNVFVLNLFVIISIMTALSMDARKIINEAERRQLQGRRLSYFCLNANTDLCMGGNPGTSPVSPLSTCQLSNFNGLTNLQRWDLGPNIPGDSIYFDGLLALELESFRLCAQSIPQSNLVGLLTNCTLASNSNWTYDSELGLLKLANKCLTVMKCVQRNDAALSCLNSIEIVETDPTLFVQGSILKLKSCSHDFSVAQTFTRQIDCSIGCSPSKLNNDICDDECNVLACAMDKGRCTGPRITSKPTIVGTLAPAIIVTSSPTTPQEAIKPCFTFHSDAKCKQAVGCKWGKRVRKCYHP
jgi:hypothetical protein